MTRGAPRDIEGLTQRARRLAGRTVAQVAEALDQEVPANLRTHKGWLGQLIEDALGATGGSRPEVDFPELGVELKTLPIDGRGRPRESTWVCAAPLDGFVNESWETSRVRHKLACVLWVPVLTERGLPLGERRLGTPLLWTMDGESEEILRADYEELSEMIRLGQLDALDATLGTWLQVRPKAAHSRVTRPTLDADGAWVDANPKGFYLRTAFTRRLLERYWRLDHKGA